jgi:putative ABC transport system permease protein
LSIGTNTAIFSVVNTTLLAALPFNHHERLVRLYDVRQRENGQTSQVSLSPRNFCEVREQAQSFDSVVAQFVLNVNLTGADGPERIVGIGVSDDWLQTLGVNPLLGRGFNPDEERAGSSARVAVISYGFWQRRLGGDSNVSGNSIVLNNEQYTVVGVLPRGFSYPYRSEVWLPYTFDRTNGRQHPLNVQARLKAGVTIEQAQVELTSIAQQLAEQFPDTNMGYQFNVTPLRKVLVEDYDRFVLLLLVATGFVLLIACANVASLLLARSVGRRKEFAVRAALGATRRRQLQQLLVENGLLAMFGGGLGVALTFGVREFLVTLIPPEITYVVQEVELNATVLLFTLFVSLVMGVGIALVPALRTSRHNLNSLLNDCGRGGTSATSHRLLNGLVVAEVAIALVLVTGAGLMIQNLYNLNRANLGFATDHLLTMKLAFNEASYGQPEQRRNLVKQAVERVRAVPGVSNAAVTNLIPLAGGNLSASFVLEGKTIAPNEQLVVSHRIVSPTYFDTMRIPVLRGRGFTDQDTINAQMVVAISQRTADRYWPNEDPIYQRVRVVSGSSSQWLTVVAIVGDIDDPKLSGEIKEMWYVPYAQNLANDRTWATMTFGLVARTAVEPAGVTQSVKEAVWQLDSKLPVFDVATAEKLLDGRLAQQRTSTVLLFGFAGFGFLLAALGTYGVIAYTVSQRRREIGIRLAFGAQTGDILQFVLRQGVKLTLIGIAIGLTGALLLTRLMASVLSEVSATDPLTFLVAATLLAAIALLASYLPAKRATKVDPISALRYE